MKYTFLILSILLIIPTVIIFLLRKDLRDAIRTTALFALPFGLTEFLFYPEYWEPVFLFDLAAKAGFGIEDLLYVSGLGGLFVSLYPFLFNVGYSHIVRQKRVLVRVLIPIGTAFILTAILAVLNVSMIWGCIPVMLSIGFGMCIQQKNLFIPFLTGGFVCSLFYLLLCLLLEFIIPNTFEIVWHAEKFSNISIFSIPLEEISYAFSAGAVATIFYPYVYSISFVKSDKPDFSC
jgi:hypothetical protein